MSRKFLGCFVFANATCSTASICYIRYIEQSSNFKNIELTFSKTEMQRELVKSLGLYKPGKESTA